MPKRRADADHRRFLDEFECVKIPGLRATGVVQLHAPHAIIQIGGRRKLIRLAHSKLANEGSWSFFRCPRCARRCNRLWLIDDRPLCVKCCNGLNIGHRTKWGFGRHERLGVLDQKLDELIAKLDATTPLRSLVPPIARRFVPSQGSLLFRLGRRRSSRDRQLL
jgi:hypothetical protein